MTAPLPTTVVLVELDEDLLTLNRVIGIMRRRNVTVASLVLGPASAGPGRSLTTALSDDPATVSRLVNQLRKTSGVTQVLVQPPLPRVVAAVPA